MKDPKYLIGDKVVVNRSEPGIEIVFQEEIKGASLINNSEWFYDGSFRSFSERNIIKKLN